MAKPPSKRRGITLGERAGSAVSVELLSTQPASPVSLASEDTSAPAGGDPGETSRKLQEELDALRRENAGLDSRWRRQSGEFQEKLHQLEQQRDELAQQTHRLQVLEQRRQSAGRLGVLLALLSLSAVAALGFHTWPRLQEVAGDVSRVSTGVGELAPQVRTVRGELTSLNADVGEMGSAVATLREDVSGVRSDLGSLRRTVDTFPESKGAVQANAGSARGTPPHTVPRNATTMTNPYRVMRPMMPW